MISAINSKNIWPGLAARLLDAGLSGNHRQLELAALTAIRTLKATDPSGAKQISAVLQKHRKTFAVGREALPPSPVDAESTFSLLNVEAPPSDTPKPVLPEATASIVDRFVRERQSSLRLIEEGFLPPASLLLCGDPGTGKTMLARWLAKELGLKMATLDLSTSISSYLGRTGANLRRILDYARSTPTLLLLDEFDSVAKRRDDNTDVGELKRIVNVLLKELENWPETSVLVAATNHSGLLDPAVFRRFERVIEVGLPAIHQRAAIFQQSLGNFAKDLGSPFIQTVAALLEEVNGSRIDQMAKAVVRRHLVDGQDLETAIIEETRSSVTKVLSPKERSQLLRSLKDNMGDEVPLRFFADLFGVSVSTIHYQFKK